MSKPRSISHSPNPPTNLVIASLECLGQIGGDSDALLREAGASYRARELASGFVKDVSVYVFTVVNRTCNAALREHLQKTGAGPTMNEIQFFLMCRCLVSCATLEEVIATTALFFTMFDGALGTVDLDLTGKEARLFISQVRHRLDDITYLIDVYGFAILHKVYRWLVDRPLPLKQVQLAYPASRLHGLHISLFDDPVLFNQERHCLVFDKGYLKYPVIRTRSEIASLTQRFAFDLVLAGYRGRSFAERVSIAITNAHALGQPFPSQVALADSLGISAWTLRRRLAEEGTAFNKVRRRCQLEMATELLQRPDLSVDAIAALVDFSDASAFSRAFQKWTGQTPADYRKALPRSSGRQRRAAAG